MLRRETPAGYRVLFGLASVLISLPAFADVSANVGWLSEYIFRGVPQKESSASAGLDFEQGGFYAGTWGADVGDGLEVDGYLGYTFEVEDLSFGVGGTGYFYTGDFDDTYREINLSAGYAGVSIDVAIGEYDNFDGPKLDYTHSAATLEVGGLHATVGIFGKDFAGNYFDVGYSFTVAEEIDLSFSWIRSNKDLSAVVDPVTQLPQADSTFVFGISKSFSLSD